MAGLVQMSEYLKVVEDRDQWREQALWLRETYEGPEWRVTQLRATIRKLTPITARMTLMLADRSPYAVPRTSMLGILNTNTELKCLDVHVCRIRRALRMANAPRGAIETVWGQGYSMTREAIDWLRDTVPSAFKMPEAA